MSSYRLEKAIWTEKEFKLMGWHDSIIHGISFSNQPATLEASILFHIDYIFQWVLDEASQTYSFFVSPCTLVFYQVVDLSMTISFGRFCSTELEIADIHLEKENQHSDTYSDYSWRIETQQGDISFDAVRFEQHVRDYPKHIQRQYFELSERNGVCFDKKGCF